MEIVCIVCPTGCRMTAEKNGDEWIITGNTCPRGAAFARAELTHPMRSLTTTVRTNSVAMPMLPVRTDGEIPKELLFDAMRQLDKIIITAPLKCGDIILPAVSGTETAVIATCDFSASGGEKGEYASHSNL